MWRDLSKTIWSTDGLTRVLYLLMLKLHPVTRPQKEDGERVVASPSWGPERQCLWTRTKVDWEKLGLPGQTSVLSEKEMSVSGLW